MAREAHALWTKIDGEPWIDNPRRRRRKRKGSHKRRRRHTAKANAPRRHRRKRGRRRMPAGLRRYLENKRRGGHRMKRRHHSRRRHGRRRFGSNPPFARGMMGRVMEGLKGGAGVVLGKAAVRAIPTMANIPRTGVIGIGAQAVIGVVLAPFVDKFLRGWGKPFLYGAFAAPLESLAVGLNLPIIGPALSSYPDELSAIPATVTALGDAGAAPGFMIDDEEQALVQ